MSGVRYGSVSALPSVDAGGNNSVIFGTAGTDFSGANITGLGVLFCCWVKAYTDVVDAGGRGDTEPFQLYGDTWHVRFVTADSLNVDVPNQTANYNPNSTLFSDGVTGVSSDTTLGDYSFQNFEGLSWTVVNGWWFIAWQIVIDTVGHTFTLRQWSRQPGGTTSSPVADTLTWAAIRDIIESKGASHSDAQAWTPGAAVRFVLKQGKLAYGRIYQMTSMPSTATVEAIAVATAPDATAFGDYRLDWIDGAADRVDRSGNGHGLTSITGTLYAGPAFP